nr:MAG TPA: hypothetical protein [Caudoviricetes sp.]
MYARSAASLDDGRTKRSVTFVLLWCYFMGVRTTLDGA